MSCDCNSPFYNGVNACGPEIPYPQVSHESVPSLIDNLVAALYGGFYNPQTQTGFITKSVVNGRIVWNIPCDPNNTAEVEDVPREQGEGLLCYMIRVFNQAVFLNATQTLTNKTLTSPVINNPTGITPQDVGADPEGSAADAEQNAKDYADSLAPNYDPAGSASIAEQNAKDYADSLAPNYDPTGSAAAAEQNAKDYADSLADNYDPAGSAADAEAFSIQRANHTGTQSSGTITGVTDGSNASAGYVGEFVSSQQTTGQTLGNGSSINVTSITLSAGDWDVQGNFLFAYTTTNSVTYTIQGGINSVSATIGGQDSYCEISHHAASAAALTQSIPTFTQRYSITTPTTLYLVAKVGAGSGLSSATAKGTIRARRVR